jgi:hypothetical protein
MQAQLEAEREQYRDAATAVAKSTMAALRPELREALAFEHETVTAEIKRERNMAQDEKAYATLIAFDMLDDTADDDLRLEFELVDRESDE